MDKLQRVLKAAARVVTGTRKFDRSRLFVLHCRSRPKYDTSRHFDPHFEEGRGGVEHWWMARWKARAEFVLSDIELLFLSLTVEALQGKTCQNSQPSGVGKSL